MTRRVTDRPRICQCGVPVLELVDGTVVDDRAATRGEPHGWGYTHHTKPRRDTAEDVLAAVIALWSPETDAEWDLYDRALALFGRGPGAE